MIADQPPQHMDRFTRNERLYRHLLSMGLVAVPIFADADRTRIDHLMVTTELPFLIQVECAEGAQTAQSVRAGDTSESAAGAGVGEPVSGAQIANVVAAADQGGDNVIDFPAVD